MNASILIIDDEKFIRNSIRHFLEDVNYTVFEAENGIKGISLFEDVHPDVVIVDLKMPELNGFEVLKIIVQSSPKTPVIVMSGTSVISDVVKSIQLGAWNYLLKPIMDLSILTQTIEKALKKAKEDKENVEYRKILEQKVAERTQKLEEANTKLSLSYKKLKENKIDLEKRVEERTKELVEINTELSIARDRADAATIAKSTFLANMSHEIRTPMNGVIAATDLALDEDVSPKTRKFLEIIKSSGNNLLSIINDILDLSKVEAGKLELCPHDFQFSELIDSISDLFISTAREKEIELIYDIDPNLPEIMTGDKTRIKQIFTNLIGNSFKFTEKKGLIKLNIGFKRINTNKILFKGSVYDNGIGITANQQKKLFKAFSQADISTTRKFGGSGLGLALCKQLLEMMNGSIFVTSEVKKETTFSFSFELNIPNTPSKDDGFFLKNKKNHAMILDSNDENITILQNQLQYLGFNVDMVSSSNEILNIDRNKLNKYDIFFVEWINKKDGLEMSYLLKETIKIKSPVIPMISLSKTDFLNIKDKDRYKSFLYKPFHRESLKKTIYKAFDKLSDKHQNKQLIKSDKEIFKNLDILVVEDNPVNQKLAIAILKKVGAVITIAENGLVAVDTLKQRSFDIVLMDIQMPEMDGHKATKIIREDLNLKEIPIIAMTAHALKGDREKCFESGMNHYISKPISRDRLFEVILDCLQKNNTVSI
ncbi:MAG: response regulator [Desulfobacterales bacterium]|nr:response regulator [Desulfobacterales bacterium]MCP4161281.1 response regulator [Deltaproteobacteria bacterium]